MSDKQIDAANAFARGKIGADADVGSKQFKGEVLDGGDGGDGEGQPQYEFIQLPGEDRPLGQFSRDLGRICKAQSIYRRETVPVTINPENGQMEAITAARFRTYVEEFCVPYINKWNKHKEEYEEKVKTMTQDTAGGVLQSDQYVYQLNRLDRVNHVRMPIRRKDGRIELLEEGYDTESNVYTMPSDVEIREMPVEEARQVIDSLLKEFPFGDHDDEGFSRSKAVAIAGMLSFFGSGLQKLNAARMNFVYSANSSRSGKSLLARFAIVPVLGNVESQTMSDSKEEFRKLLDTEAMASSPCIFLDDLEGNIKNTTLNAFMTASVWAGRMMGSQKKFKAPKVSQVFLTGNNLTLSPDISNRSLLCELYMKEADPQARKVKRVIDEHVLGQSDVRSDILSALWSLIQHWDKEGRPGCDRPFAGFQEWSDIFGGMVICNGWGSPLARPDTDHSGDTEMRDMLDLVEILVDRMGTVEEMDFEFSELGKICVENSLFTWMITYDDRPGAVVGERNIELTSKSKSICGKLWTGKYGGRIFVLRDGRRVEFGTRGKNRQKKYEVKILQG